MLQDVEESLSKNENEAAGYANVYCMDERAEFEHLETELKLNAINNKLSDVDGLCRKLESIAQRFVSFMNNSWFTSPFYTTKIQTLSWARWNYN